MRVGGARGAQRAASIAACSSPPKPWSRRCKRSGGAGDARRRGRRDGRQAVSEANAKPAPPQPSSIAKASRALKKGALYRSAWLRCGQEDQRQEAPPSCRYAGFVAPRHRSPRRYPGSRRRYPASCSFGMYPFLKKLFADGGYQGPEFHKALTKLLPQLETEIIKRSDQAKGFVVLPRRRVVERTIAWLNRCRRLAKDWENLNRKALAFLASHQSASCSENFVIPLDVPDSRSGSPNLRAASRSFGSAARPRSR